jgi:hypothetical protein
MIFQHRSRRLVARPKSRPNFAACIPRQPGLRSACVLVPSRQNPPGPRARLGKKSIIITVFLDAIFPKTCSPQEPDATELRHRCTAPSLPLHSAGKVSSLRGIDQRDQSGFGFSAVLDPNPKPLSSRRAGAPTTHLRADTKSDTIGVKKGIAGLCRIMLNSQWNRVYLGCNSGVN